MVEVQGAFPGEGRSLVGRFWAGVIAAVRAGGLAGFGGPAPGGSGGDRRERFEFLECGEELLGPGPGVLEV